MTIRDLIQKALDPMQPEGMQLAAARKVADFCRFKLGMTFDQTLTVVQEVDPTVTPAQWDGLMYDCDREESQG